MKQIQKGFTLIELMIVVAIIGILAAVAIPAYQDYIIKAKLSKIPGAVDPIKLAYAEFYQFNGAAPGAIAFAGDWSSLGLSGSPTATPEVASIALTANDANGTACTSGGTAVQAITVTIGTGIKTGTVDGKLISWCPTFGQTATTWAMATDSTEKVVTELMKKWK